jgi:1-acyl-sn-glycerol-3-phosphate acyltransferase/nucleoside-diphosphate-sugar epimerase
VSAGRPGVLVVGGDGPLTRWLGEELGAPVETGEVREIGAGVETVVYVARERGGLPTVDDARVVLEACRDAGVEHVVVVSSAEVWEPGHHHPGQVSETPLGPARKELPVVRAWRELEAVSREALGEAGTKLTVLRPAATPIPGGGDPWSRWLAGKVAPAFVGHDPSVQLLDPQDLVQGVRRAMAASPGGTFHLAPAGVAPLRRAFGAAGVRRVPGLGRLGRRGDRSGAPAQLRYPWTVSDRAARETLGYEPRHDTLGTARRFAAALGRRAEEPGETTERFDDFGMDRGYIEKKSRGLFRWAHDRYWRVELAGLEHLPREGRAVLTGIHRGFMPFDGIMALHAVHRETGRIPRFLIHPALVKFPFIADFMTRLGGLVACRDSAARVLEDDEILGIFPEGIRGAFCLYKDAYRLQRFGRDEFVKMALRHRAPIVPFVTVGSAEIFPVWKKLHWRWWQRVSEWPCLPLTPTFPLLPVPLPSKWHTRFLEPLHVERLHPPEAADDPAVVRALSRQVQDRMRTALLDLRARRPSVFFGSRRDTISP